MNNFYAYVKENGTYSHITGQAIFPFSFSNLLDEGLDESYLRIVGDTRKVYSPTTEMRIDLVQNAREENETTTSTYYIVASDNAYEFPNGSGMYKHEIYLIERTKLLEGIVCQSLTFTNSLGTVYTDSKYVAPISVLPDSDFNVVSCLSSGGKNLPIYTPVSTNGTTVPSAQIVSEIVASCFESFDGYPGVAVPSYTFETIHYTSQSTYQNGQDAPVTLPYTESATIPAKNPLVITYCTLVRFQQNGIYHFANFYYSVSLTAVENQYPTKRWTITDCVNRVLDLCQPIREGETPKYTFRQDQSEAFDKVMAPEFTMTQCHLREQLKIIGGYIHGEPRLDENNQVYFELYGSTSRTTDRVYVHNGVKQSINEYCTAVDTSAQNIVNQLDYAQGVVIHPDAVSFQTTRTEAVNMRVEETNGIAATQFPVQSITQVLCGLYNADGTWNIEPVDITPYIFERQEYFANLSSYEGGYPRSKAYAAYYTIGGKGIDGLFFKQENAISPVFENYSIINILHAATGEPEEDIFQMIFNTDQDYALLSFRISYVPIYSTRFTHSKPYLDGVQTGYTKIYNQAENMIETRYYGENVKGAVARLGNVDQERTYILKNLSQIPKIGDVLGANEEMRGGSYVSAVSCNYMPLYIKCTVSLTKDFNRLSQYVGISSNKRIYEVSERQTYNRDIILKEYCIVGNAGNYTHGIARIGYQLQSIFDKNPTVPEDYKVYPITACNAWGGTYSHPRYADQNEQNTPLPCIQLPVISSAFGNCMVFSWAYKDNYSAGDYVRFSQNGNVSGYFQQDAPYGDYYGRMFYYNFSLLSKNETNAGGLTFALNSPNSNPDVPITNNFRRGITTENGKHPYLIRKDNREALNFNFSVEFITNRDDLIIGSSLAANCRLVSETTENPRLYFLKNKVGKFDNKVKEDMTGYASAFISIVSSSPDVICICASGQCDKESLAWVIATPQKKKTITVQDESGNVTTQEIFSGGDILIAGNAPQPTGNTMTQTIYLSMCKSIFN